MEQFSAFIEKHLAPLANKVGRNRYVQAIQSAFLTMVPFMTIGSFALIIIEPVLDYTELDPGLLQNFMHGWSDLASFVSPVLSPLNFATVGCLAMYVAFGLGFYLARGYKMNTFLPTVVTGAAFILTCAIDVDGNFTTDYLGSTGLFGAIIVSFLTVEAYRWLSEREIGKIDIGGQGVPPALMDSFANLVPATIVLLVVAIVSAAIKAIAGVPLPDVINVIMEPLVGAIDNVWGVAILAALVMILWWFGIHDSVITTPLDVILYHNLGENMTAYAAGTAASSLPYVLTPPVWWTFMTIGGSGATFSLCLLALFSKSKQIRTVGKLAIVPSFFNINEPIIFGLPLMYNPVMMFPFIFTMVFNGVVTYLCMDFGLVNRVFSYPSWNLFAPIAAFLETMDFRAVILVLVLIVADGLIYYPFFKIYEKQKLEEEAQQEAAAAVKEA